MTTFGVGIALQIGIMLLLVVGLVGPVQAQERKSTQSQTLTQKHESLAPTWRANFGVQAGRLLEEETSASIREAVLKNIIQIAIRQPDVDLSATIQPLVHVVKTDSDSQLRVMALQALHSIDPAQADRAFYDRAMTQVNVLMNSEPSEQVRRVASAALASYVS